MVRPGGRPASPVRPSIYPNPLIVIVVGFIYGQQAAEELEHAINTDQLTSEADFERWLTDFVENHPLEAANDEVVAEVDSMEEEDVQYLPTADVLPSPLPEPEDPLVSVAAAFVGSVVGVGALAYDEIHNQMFYGPYPPGVRVSIANPDTGFSVSYNGADRVSFISDPVVRTVVTSDPISGGSRTHTIQVAGPSGIRWLEEVPASEDFEGSPYRS